MFDLFGSVHGHKKIPTHPVLAQCTKAWQGEHGCHPIHAPVLQSLLFFGTRHFRKKV